MSKQYIKLVISKPKNNPTNNKLKNNLTNSELENDLTNSEPKNNLTNSELENNLTNSESKNNLTNSEQSIDCPICLDEIKTNDALNILALTCGHITCFECVFKWIESCIINRNYPLTCPVCRAELQYWEIENMFNYQPLKNNRFDIDKRVFHKYDTYLLEKSINTMDNAMWCPKGCGDAILIENDSITRIVCPGCKEVFCFKCQTKWHPETTCILYKKMVK